MSTLTADYLQEAVHHHKAATRRGILERAFTLWFQGFVYSQIWEDPRVDAKALELGPGSRMLTISSGGCNVLNYLVHNPEKIVALDLNTCHMSLARLKLSAVQTLPDYESFYRFFGFGRHPENVPNYHKYVRGSLDAQTRTYWEGRNLAWGQPGRRISYFRKGLYDQSKLGLFFRVCHGLARGLGKRMDGLLRCQTLDEQREFFRTTVDPFFQNKLVQWVVSHPAAVFSLGIPPAQHQIMEVETGGRVIDSYRQRMYKLACEFPIQDNYFAWQAFGRRYDHERREAVPDYLKARNFQTIRENAQRVETHIKTLADYLRSCPDKSLNRFVLLDSQDWMPPEVIEELWREIDRVGMPGSRIIFRTAGERSPVESALPAELLGRFVADRETAHRLHQEDRSAIYGMFHLYIKPE